MSYSYPHFLIGIKDKYSQELRAKEGQGALSPLYAKINAEHGAVLGDRREFPTRELCEKAWAKLPKEIQDITKIFPFSR